MLWWEFDEMCQDLGDGGEWWVDVNGLILCPIHREEVGMGVAVVVISGTVLG